MLTIAHAISIGSPFDHSMGAHAWNGSTDQTLEIAGSQRPKSYDSRPSAFIQSTVKDAFTHPAEKTVRECAGRAFVRWQKTTASDLLRTIDSNESVADFYAQLTILPSNLNSGRESNL